MSLEQYPINLQALALMFYINVSEKPWLITLNVVV